MSDEYKDWLKRAEVDYFPPFINLFLAFNIWYRKKYNNPKENTDRYLINCIKEDFNPDNILWKNLKNYLQKSEQKDVLEFQSNLEQFHYALIQAELEYEKTPDRKVTFENALIARDKKENDSWVNLLASANTSDKEKNNENEEEYYENESESEKDEEEQSIKLDSIHIIDDHEKIMAGLVEIIYEIRCHLFHGSLKPKDENHEVVKYAYFVLFRLFKP